MLRNISFDLSVEVVSTQWLSTIADTLRIWNSHSILAVFCRFVLSGGIVPALQWPFFEGVFGERLIGLVALEQAQQAVYFIFNAADIADSNIKATTPGILPFSLVGQLNRSDRFPSFLPAAAFRPPVGAVPEWRSLAVFLGGPVGGALHGNSSLLLNLIITNMLGAHSPEKENRSPEARRKEKHKEIKTPHQLLQILPAHGITLSQQLAAQILHSHHPHHQEIKRFAGKKEEEAHQLRVKLADYEFELKKMGEDFAEFQLLAKMERDKHLKRLREQLEAQRAKNEEDSSKWEEKFAERKAQHERDCEEYKERVDEEGGKAIADALSKMQHKHDEFLHRMNYAHEETVKNLNKTIEHLKVDFQHRLQTQKDSHHKELLSLRKTHEAELKERQEIFETKMVAAQSEKKAETRIVEQARKEGAKMQQRYLMQIGTIQRGKRKLQEKFDEMEMKCKILTTKLDDRTEQIEALKQLHAEQLEKAELDRNRAMQKARSLLNHERAQFLRQEYARTEQIQLKLIKLDQAKQQMQHDYDGLLRTLETRFERRESKRQDVAALRQYEQQLVSKQRENSQIYQQLRMVQLEKENNDKIYTRIFTANKKDKKSLSQKEALDLHALFKQSNTTDFRHLLKMAHK